MINSFFPPKKGPPQPGTPERAAASSREEEAASNDEQGPQEEQVVVPMDDDASSRKTSRPPGSTPTRANSIRRREEEPPSSAFLDPVTRVESFAALSKSRKREKALELLSAGRPVQRLQQNGLDITYQSGSTKRYFRQEWLDNTAWLEQTKVDDTTRKVFCFACTIRCSCGSAGQTTQGGSIDNNDYVKGLTVSNTWVRKCGEKIKSHESSVAHLNSVAWVDDMLKSSEASNSLPETFERVSDGIKAKNFRYFLMIFQIIIHLAIGGVAFRGHNEKKENVNRGNFLNTVKFLRDVNHEFDERCKNAPENATYTSATVQNEMIETVASAVASEIVKDVGNAAFSLLIDESEDISQHEQMAVGIRYTSKNDGVTKERFLGLVRVPNTKAQTLKDAVVNFCTEFGLNMENLRGQGYDGASNMSGHIGGLQALLRLLYPYAFYVHCMAHRLNLVVECIIESVPALNTFLDTLKKVRKLVTGSSKRHTILEKALRGMVKLTDIDQILHDPKPADASTRESQKKSVPVPNETRWYGYQALVFAMVQYIATVYGVINVLIADDGTTAVQAAEMEGLVGMMLQFNFLFCAVVVQPLLKDLDMLSKSLQSPRSDLQQAQDMAKATITELEDSKLKFEEYWKKAKKYVASINMQLPDDDSVSIPTDNEIYSGRRGNRSRGMGRAGVPGADVPPPATYTTMQHLKDSVYIPIYEKLIDEMKKRFTEEGMTEIFRGIDALNPANRFSNLGNEEKIGHIIAFAELYKIDFDVNSEDGKDDLKRILKRFRSWVCMDTYREEVDKMKTIPDVLSFLIKKGHTTGSFRDVFKLYELAACLPVSSAEVERAFSSMSYIKNYLRNSMGDDRLSQLMLLYKSPDIVSTLDLDVLVKKWHVKKDRRMPI